MLVRIIAPVLSFTADEIWERIPETLKEEESVHLSKWIEARPEYLNKELAQKWDKIARLRREVNKKLEAERQNGLIGHSLDARVLLNIANEKNVKDAGNTMRKLDTITIIQMYAQDVQAFWKKCNIKFIL